MLNWLKSLSPFSSKSRNVAQSGDTLPLKGTAKETLPSVGEKERGDVYLDQGAWANACHCYLRAIALDANYADAHNNLGYALAELGRFDEAKAHLQQALSLNPKLSNSYYTLGKIASRNNNNVEAIDYFWKAVSARQDFAEAWEFLGYLYLQQGEIKKAVDCYQTSLSVNPILHNARSSLLFAYNYIPNLPITTFIEEARRYGEMIAQQITPYSNWPNVVDSGRILRIGMVSGDLRNHPVGFFVEGILAALTANPSCQLELTAYATNAATDALTDRIKTSFRHWRTVENLSDEAFARQIREDGVDILIDLSGHTADNRLPVFAWKPAPIQISWLGNLATTGIAAMDYVIADAYAAPENEAGHFTENILRLADTCLCFTPQDKQIEVSPLPALTNGYITFGSFNNLTKMNDAVVALWAQVLHAVPDSRLYLKSKPLDEITRRQSVIQQFSQHQIDESRLIFEGFSSRSALYSYQHIDIALDTFPYSGVTTSVEALWMGVPVLALRGDRFLSHIGESILHNARLADWIAADADEYVNLAVHHANNVQSLVTLRQELREQVLHSPLFDAPRFAGNLETALRQVWQQWCEQQP